MEERTNQEWDVIVVGAGLSGLTAAYHLIQTMPGCKVLVLEAKDRVGGRTLTMQMQGSHGADSWDLGGQWVSSSQHHVMWLLNELDVESYPQFNTGIKLLQLAGTHRITEHLDNIPSLPLLSLLDLNRFITNMDIIAKDVPCDEPWKAPVAEEFDGMTMEQLVENYTWTSTARETIETGYQVVNGGRLREQSALSYIFYVSSAGGNQKLVESTKGTAQEMKVKGGVQNVCLQLAEKVGVSNIRLSEPVTVIDQSQPDRVKIETLSGKKFSSKYIIVAVPPSCAASLQYLPDPPAKRQRLMAHMHVGHLFKFIATYKKAFWREAGYSGEIVSSGSKSTMAGCDKGPVQYVMDATTSNDNPALVGFIGNPVQWGQVSCEERKAAILNHLADFLGPDAKTPIDFMEKDWALEPYNGGCPVSMMETGALAYWDSIRTPVSRIHWAGTETASQWMGYLSGAVQSGLRAADEVASRLHPEETATRDLLTSLDRIRADTADNATGGSSMLWSLGKVALIAAFIGFAVRRVWLTGSRINLPWDC